MSVEKNSIVEQLLRRAGFTPEHEPAWVTDGEVPDFFCTGPRDLWVEVKATDDAERFRSLSQQWDWIKARAAMMSERGRAFFLVSENATDRDIKAGFALIKDAYRLQAENPAGADRIYSVVPNDPDFGSRVRLIIPTEQGAELLVCAKSKSGHYGRPQLDRGLAGDPEVTILEENDHPRIAPASDLGLHDDDFLVGVVIKPAGMPFEIEGVFPTGPARRVTTTQIVRRAASKANSQFKNACKFRNAPCLLVMFQDGLLVQEPRAFAAAFYGNLQYEFPLAPGSDGKLVFGRDGFWGPTKNRTMSASCLIRNNGQPIVVHNPWATAPIPPGIFGWPEGRILSDGMVELPAD